MPTMRPQTMTARFEWVPAPVDPGPVTRLPMPHCGGCGRFIAGRTLRYVNTDRLVGDCGLCGPGMELAP